MPVLYTKENIILKANTSTKIILLCMEAVWFYLLVYLFLPSSKPELYQKNMTVLYSCAGIINLFFLIGLALVFGTSTVFQETKVIFRLFRKELIVYYSEIDSFRICRSARGGNSMELISRTTRKMIISFSIDFSVPAELLLWIIKNFRDVDDDYSKAELIAAYRAMYRKQKKRKLFWQKVRNKLLPGSGTVDEKKQE